MNIGLFFSRINSRALCGSLIFLCSLLLAGCGGDSGQVKPLGQYEAGSKTQEDLENALKADARVAGYEPSGDTITINVTSEFTAAPYGMQQRALWSWYNTWQAAKSGSKTATVIVNSNGTEVARWNHSDGYKPAAQAKSE